MVTRVPLTLRRLATLFAIAALLATTAVVSTPASARADGGGQTFWGSVCVTGNLCFPGGLARIYVYGRGDQIHKIKGQFASSNLSNWRITYRLYETDGTSQNLYHSRDGALHSTTNISGEDVWTPDAFPAKTGKACISVWSNGLKMATTCLSITPANVIVRSDRSRRCLDADVNGGGRNGTKVQLWKCNGKAQQGWRLDSNGAVRSIKYPSKCLDADLNTIGRNGTVVQLWDCNNERQQQFTLSSGGTIRNLHSNQCLDADLNTIGRNGTVVQLWGCNGEKQQSWS